MSAYQTRRAMIRAAVSFTLLITGAPSWAAQDEPVADGAPADPAPWPVLHIATQDDGLGDPLRAGPDGTLGQPGAAADGLGDLDMLLNADLEQLSRTDVVVPGFSEEVTTVTREESTVGRSPAAVYVITGEMIRRSGARCIPDALRLAPGVQVAQLDANKWSISIRGFNRRFSNKLLVQIDGRSIYTPLFAGVYWDVQDVLLEDIDRIEVIRGPGASLWGANAVNGVINIITKSAQRTHGIFAEGGGGNERQFGSARIGGQHGNVSWRTYGKWFDRDAGFLPAGNENDDWEISRGGFRTDWSPNCCDTVTVQGDYYAGDAGQRQLTEFGVPPFASIDASEHQLSGGNVMLRWQRKFNQDVDWTFQTYYDRTERLFTGIDFDEDRDTVDLDFQIRFPWRRNHSIIWGAGYRNTRDKIRNSDFQIRFVPTSRSVDTFNTYIQDQITLHDDLLFLTIGSKFSWNDFTGFEIQPTARLLYTPSKRQTVWASVSRAVRTPTRVEHDIRLTLPPSTLPVNPTFPLVIGDRGVDSEQLLAWEMGIRSAPSDDLFWDLAVFYHQYDDLIAVEQGIPGVDPDLGQTILPLPFVNGVNGDGYGFELAATTVLSPTWSVRSAYSFLKLDLNADANVFDNVQGTEGDPRNQFFFHSSWDLGCHWEFDLMGRYVDVLRIGNIPSYFELDTRIGWRPNDQFDFALVGRNLLDSAHPEFANDDETGTRATEVQRELFGIITWRY